MHLFFLAILVSTAAPAEPRRAGPNNTSSGLTCKVKITKFGSYLSPQGVLDTLSPRKSLGGLSYLFSGSKSAGSKLESLEGRGAINAWYNLELKVMGGRHPQGLPPPRPQNVSLANETGQGNESARAAAYTYARGYQCSGEVKLEWSDAS